jgi:CHAT domain-containing protein/Tfp pilus assembly protein PilF
MRSRRVEQPFYLFWAISLSGSTLGLGVKSAVVPAQAGAAAQVERKPEPGTPPWKRQLSGEAASRVAKLEQQIAQLKREGRFGEAIEPAREVAEIRKRLQGADHWEAGDARRAVEDLQKIAALPEEARKAMASVGELEKHADLEKQRGHYAQAETIDRTLLEIRRKWLGEGHPLTAAAYDDVGENLYYQGKYTDAELLYRNGLSVRLKELGEQHPDTAESYNNLADCLDRQGKYAAAEPLHRQAVAIWSNALGEDHSLTGVGYGNLAGNLDYQRRHVEAEPLHRRVLAIQLRAVGAQHPRTAVAYNNLAYNLNSQGNHAESEPLHRTALAIRLKAFGHAHPTTALSYNNLAFALSQQGKHADAEPLFRQALAIYLGALGEDHPSTALGYNNLAVNLTHQGKYAEAERLHRQALSIRLRALGADPPNTAISYNNLATCLVAQGRSAEAEPLYRQSLAIRLKALGEGHADSAQGYKNLADSLHAQGKHVEAELLYRQALAIHVKTLGEDHPETAVTYENLANNLDAQKKYAEAEPFFRKALASYVKALGEHHPFTASGYNDLALNLDAQGRLSEAVANWMAAAEVVQRARQAQGASGLERSLAPLRSPLPALAIALARQGKSHEAWARWEADLARGLLDDLSARSLRPLTPDQRRREADLAGQLQRLDERITRLAAKPRRSEDEDKQIELVQNQRSILRGQWVEFQNSLDHQYQAFAGKPSTLEDVRNALPADAALVGWLDVRKHHWAGVVRREGDPLWVKLPGIGEDGAWTKADDAAPGKLRDALADKEAAWRAPAEVLARQRLTPLIPHLNGVRHLIVVPSPALAGVPIEAVIEALPAGSPRPMVTYAPSGSMFARLSAARSRSPGALRLLALGDPAFPKPAPGGPAPGPPDHGIAIVAVVPNSTADLCGIKPGDVLLEYNGKLLKSQSDLAVVAAGEKAIRVPVKLWRDGEVRSLEIAAGPLGIQSNPNQPAAQVVLAQRAAAEVLDAGARGEALTPLPGTRREVQAIAGLFPREQVTTLLGADATESKLQQLARSGALKNYRFLHLATHGKANPSVALSSAVFLAAEPERPAASADPSALESYPDGQITAEQIVRTWDLDADLVVLSACESGLGRYAGGEGYLGFAQALFVKGARSLVLSQWKVDDKATALLMTRFYQNLLGRRAGLSQPLQKAEALDEAKHWLRNLRADQIGGELAALERGTVRPLAPGGGQAPHDTSPTPRPAGVPPYAHPYYWASFVLVGDPR